MKTQLVAGLLSACLWGCTPSQQTAETEHTIQSPASVDRISLSEFEEKVQSALDAKLAPGFSFAVVENGKLIWMKGFGYSDIINQKPVTQDTIFPLGSISKTFIGTAAAIAIAEDGFDPTRPITDYLSFSIDDPRGYAVPITFINLATHTSGVIDVEDAYETAYSWGEPVHSISLSSYLKSYLVRNGDLYDTDANFAKSSPGQKYEYSNIASALAAQALGDYLGIPFEKYTKDKIFEPLGMDSTTWFLPEANPEKVAVLYEPSETGFEPYEQYALATWPDGGLRTSTKDLVKYLSSFMNSSKYSEEQGISNDIVNIAIGPHEIGHVENLPKKEISAGLFWSKNKAPSGLSMDALIGHNGADPGIWTIMQFDPVSNRGVIAIANADMVNTEDIRGFYRLGYGLFRVDFTKK